MKERIVYSIIVPFLNEEKVIRGFLDSICRIESKLPFELIMVDGASTDKSVEIIHSYKDKIENLTVITETKPTIGAARKAGARVAKGEILISGDADIKLSADCLDLIGKEFAKNKKIVGLVGIYKFGDKNWLFNFFFVSAMKFFDFISRLITGTYIFRGLVSAVSRDAYFEAGEYNSNISALEDVELSLRVKEFGKIKYVPRWFVVSSYRRFEGRFFKQLWKRLKAYYFRAILRDNKSEAEWEAIR